MANMKVVYSTSLQDISSEETTSVILLCAVRETPKVPITGEQRHQLRWKRTISKKACESIVVARVCNYDLNLMILT